MKVSALASQAIAITVKLRKVEFTYRPLSMAVSSEIDAAFASERPDVPYKPHPMAGSADITKFRPDPSDASYVAKRDRYIGRVTAAKLAVSLGLESEDGRKYEAVPVAERPAWLAGVADKMANVLSEDEVAGIVEVVSEKTKALSQDLQGN